MAVMARLLVTILLLPMAFSCQAICFEQAGARYGIAPSVLKAISVVESGSNPVARNRNRDGLEDIGHMQINSRWLGALSSYGIGRAQLLDPCINSEGADGLPIDQYLDRMAHLGSASFIFVCSRMLAGVMNNATPSPVAI